MEAGFLNFHDEEHFSDFSLSLDHQHNLLAEPQNALVHMVDTDFDYIQRFDLDSNSSSQWEMEQEHNGDLALLPASGVAGVVPRIENMKEDFAKMLTDWNEHIGYLQASEVEDDITLDVGLPMNDINAPSQDIPKLKVNNLVKQEQSLPQPNDTCIGDINLDFDQGRNRVSESDQSEIGGNILRIKREPQKEVIKEEPMDLDDNAFCASRVSEEIPIINHVKSRESEELKKKKNQKGNQAPGEVPKKSNKDTKPNRIDQESKDFASCSSKKQPVLEAVDVTSLLEQFEATEATASLIPPSTERQMQSHQATVEKVSPKHPVNPSRTISPKETIKPQNSKLHQDIRESLPKEVIDRIKASGRKKTIPVIPAIPNAKPGMRNGGTRMQEAAMALSRNKLLKLVTSSATNNAGRIDGSIQLDHDYCGNSPSAMTGSINKNCIGSLKSNSRKNLTTTKKNWSDKNAKKDSGLESGDVSDASEEQPPISLLKKVHKHDTSVKEQARNNKCGKVVNSDYNKGVSLLTINGGQRIPPKPIQSALATSILQLRKGVLTKTKSLDSHKPPHMISVLKKPPAATTPQKILGTNLKESIVTTTNSSNNPVQNIIIQETTDVEIPEEVLKKPPRRKLNLAEYRSRREQNRSDGSRTSSPVQPMVLIYIHHVSTNTEPINSDPENPVLSEREIVSVLKPKNEVEEEKCRPKRPTKDRGMQTTETVFGICYETEPEEEDLDAVEEQREQSLLEEELSKCTPPEVLPVEEPINISPESVEESLDNSVKPVEELANISEKTVEESSSILAKPIEESSNISEKSVEQSSSILENPMQESSSIPVESTEELSSISGKIEPVNMVEEFSSTPEKIEPADTMEEGEVESGQASNDEDMDVDKQKTSAGNPKIDAPNVKHTVPLLRLSFRSNYGRSQWSPRRNGKQRYKRSYDKYRRKSPAHSHRFNSWRRSPLPSYRKPYDEWHLKEKQRQVEERRVIYVGRLKDSITKAELRRRFENFGPVVDISIHFREKGHNYGFVTFAYKNDAYQAVEHGNDDPSLPRYDLCFGGRRAFCKVKYADLDGGVTNSSLSAGRSNLYKPPEEENTFDLLLKEAQAKLRKRKA
ncbi:hypothetical protein QAD02_008757 [Eretmocerus hayati]|uniref:Uncharacterized protein n=1 Tax=Eretmocerus hayati TaxID=131215 RepID=A0ACC2NBU6_9HYME|nr:hypothetical protein QAD02_008757 [Eretmocerus hayati]